MKLQIKNDVSSAASITQWDKTVDRIETAGKPTDLEDIKSMQPGDKLPLLSFSIFSFQLGKMAEIFGQLLATYHFVSLDINQGGQDLIVALLWVLTLLGMYPYALSEESFGKARRRIHFVSGESFGYRLTLKEQHCHQQMEYP
eukprot:scaffold125000_cov55-Attheya_sp.AAC.1